MKSNLIDRRQFTIGAAAAVASLAAAPRIRAADDKTLPYKICAFIKYIQTLSYDELADSIAAAGFDGVEVTARQKDSYIHPDRAAEELPRLKKALDRRGLAITILTTDILRADEPHAEPMLQVASELGIERYRLGFHRYDLTRDILPQLTDLRPVFRGIASMNRKLGIAAVYQNHAGAEMVGATIWDLHSLLKDYPVHVIGCVFDIRHATAEAGEAWPVYYDLMKPHLGAVSVKDFRWSERKSEHTPLGDGQVDPRFFKMLRHSDFAGPISLHVEYLPNAGTKENLAALNRDFKTLRGWLANLP